MPDPSPGRRLSRRGMLRGAVLLGAAAATAPGIAAAQAPAPAPAAPGDGPVAPPTIHSREAWRARPPRGGVPMIGTRPERIVVHHTATPNHPDSSLARAYALSRGIQNFHQGVRGWPDTGQQFTIGRGGQIMEGRAGSLAALRDGRGFPLGTHAPSQNNRSIGIENEGTYITGAPPAALYDALVQLCAYLCQQYRIPPTEIAGHREFSRTQCPGEVLFAMLPQLRADVAVALDTSGGGVDDDFAVVVDSTSGRFSAGPSWQAPRYADDAHGAFYHLATPVLARDPAWFRVAVPAAGNYLVDAWWPAGEQLNPLAPFVIITSTGSRTSYVDQRAGGGRWFHLGTFPLAEGDDYLVGVSRWTTGAGYLAADAVRVRAAAAGSG